MIYEKSEKQRPFSVASIAERITICDFKRQQNDFEIKELTAINSDDKYDCLIMSGDCHWITEIKNRTCQINAFPDNWIEVDKLDELLLLSKQKNMPAKLIQVFTDGLAIWDIHDILNRYNDGQTVKRMQKYKEYSVSASNKKKVEEVMVIQRSWATIYNYKRNLDIYKRAELWLQKNENSKLMEESWKIKN